MLSKSVLLRSEVNAELARRAMTDEPILMAMVVEQILHDRFVADCCVDEFRASKGFTKQLGERIQFNLLLTTYTYYLLLTTYYLLFITYYLLLTTYYLLLTTYYLLLTTYYLLLTTYCLLLTTYYLLRRRVDSIQPLHMAWRRRETCTPRLTCHRQARGIAPTARIFTCVRGGMPRRRQGERGPMAQLHSRRYLLTTYYLLLTTYYLLLTTY